MERFKVVCRPCEAKENAVGGFCAKVVEKVSNEVVEEFCTLTTKDLLDGKISAEEFSQAMRSKLVPMGLKEEDIAQMLRETTESLGNPQKEPREHDVHMPESPQLRNEVTSS